ncbi:MAG: glycosyltransferase family 2 protein [Caldilineaceae bacterium]
MASKVYIIVLNWNQYKLTADCIRSLLKVDYPNYRVLVVDNGSQDDTVSKLGSEFVDKIDLITNDKNLGFSGGNNVGIRFALAQGANYVMLLNNDTVANDPLFVRKLVDIAENDRHIGMASPSIFYFDDPERVWYAGSALDLWKGWRHYYLVPGDKMAIETGYASGCCVLISAQMIQEIGTLNESYFLTVEDVEWSLRAKHAGWRVVYVPDACLLHKDSISSKAHKGKGVYSPLRVYHEYRNTIWLIREYGNLYQKWLIWPILFGSKLIYQSLGYIIFRRWLKLKALLLALKDGLLAPSSNFKHHKGRIL